MSPPPHTSASAVPSLERHDRRIGINLPAAGTVASVVSTAVLDSDTPTTARATFSVQLDGAGKVVGVGVVSFTDGAPARWERVTRTIAAQLSGRPLMMTGAYAKGAVVTVTATSVVQFPAGSKSEGPIEREHGTVTVTLGDLSNIGAHPQRVVSTRFDVQPAQ
jgi:hypothetical protein